MKGFEEWTMADIERINALRGKSRIGVGLAPDVQVRIEAETPKPSKYHNVKTVVDGITFDSAKEAKRYQELRIRERVREIRDLKRQQRFELTTVRTDIHGNCAFTGGPDTLYTLQVIAYYVADFTYNELVNSGQSDCLVPSYANDEGSPRWQFVVEDVKGMRTKEYKLKKRHFEAQYGVTIREI